MSSRLDVAEHAAVARDVRLAAQGPTVIEAHVGGDPDVPPTAGGRDLLAPQFRGFRYQLRLHVA